MSTQAGRLTRTLPAAGERLPRWQPQEYAIDTRLPFPALEPAMSLQFALLSSCLATGLLLAVVLGLPAMAMAAEGPAVTRSKQSGPWSAADTWEGGKVPGAGARVQIRSGHTVTYDVQSDEVIRAINVAGTLAFARDRDTRLDVGLIKIEAGDAYSEERLRLRGHVAEADADQPRAALEVGTPSEPIAAEAHGGHPPALRRGLDKESCPAIVCCGGRMDFHGAPLSRTWVKLGDDREEGRRPRSTLAEAVTGWRVGDRVIVTATNCDDQQGRPAPRSGRSRRSTATQAHARRAAGATSTWATASTAARSPT